MLIYKIFRANEWTQMQVDGETRGAPVDLADNYVHFSTEEQVRETAAKHFAGETELTLIAVEADTLGADLRWEVSRGGQEFPHLYRMFRMSDVLWSESIAVENGMHVFTDRMTGASD
ncbi:MAG: DUF952 domain-containing protein [Roseobacter sp.]